MLMTRLISGVAVALRTPGTDARALSHTLTSAQCRQSSRWSDRPSTQVSSQGTRQPPMLLAIDTKPSHTSRQLTRSGELLHAGCGLCIIVAAQELRKQGGSSALPVLLGQVLQRRSAQPEPLCLSLFDFCICWPLHGVCRVQGCCCAGFTLGIGQQQESDGWFQAGGLLAGQEAGIPFCRRSCCSRLCCGGGCGCVCCIVWLAVDCRSRERIDVQEKGAALLLATDVHRPLQPARCLPASVYTTHRGSGRS